MSGLQILSNPFISVCLNVFLTVNKGVSGIVLEFFINTLQFFELKTCKYFRKYFSVIENYFWPHPWASDV